MNLIKWRPHRAEQKVTTESLVKVSTNADEVKRDLESIADKVKNLTAAIQDLREELETLEKVSLKISIEVEESK